MNKRILSLVLAFVLLLGSFATVQAAEEAKENNASQDAKIQWLVDNKIVVGKNVNKDGSADLALEDNVTRAEITKLIVYTLKLEKLADALKGVMKPFPDVDIEHWANGYISVATTKRDDVANGKRIIIGYPDGKFYPENNVTYAELATMLVRIVKKDLTDKMEAEAIWATSWMRWAEEEGILKGLTVTDSNKAVVRKDAFEMIYNAMYKLEKTNYNRAEYGDVIGVISRLQAGKIELNQDKEKLYKVDYNTVATDGTTWKSLSENSNLTKDGVGSLVRLIADKDGNITHIVELGNPAQGAIDYGNKNANTGVRNPRWFSVAEKTIGAGYEPESADYARISDGKHIQFVKGGQVKVDATINKDTKLFVADIDKAHFKQVEKLDDIFNIYKLNSKDIKKVYMGYDTYNKRDEAQVLVFHLTDKFKGVNATRRVIRPLNTKYEFEVEKTNGELEVFNLKNAPLFPAAEFINHMDVINIRYSDYSNNLRSDGKRLYIDYSEDPIYEVKKVDQARRELTLVDKDGWARDYYLPADASIFLEGQLKKGAHVQIYPNDISENVYRYGSRDHAYVNERKFETEAEVTVISVVKDDLRGILRKGTRKAPVEGWIINAQPAKVDGFDSYTVTLVDKYGRTIGNYQIARTDVGFIERHRDVLNSRNVGENKYKVLADLDKKFGNTGYLFNLAFYESQRDMDNRKASELLSKYYDALVANKDVAKAEKDLDSKINNLIDLKDQDDLKLAKKLVEQIADLNKMPKSTIDERAAARARAKAIRNDIANVKDADNKLYLGVLVAKVEKQFEEATGQEKKAPVFEEIQSGIQIVKLYKLNAKDYPEARSFTYYNASGDVLGEKVSMDQRVAKVSNDAYYKVELFDASGKVLFSGNVSF